jgi:hypothetical protein
MPIHVTFAQHVKNAAFAALFNAKAKIKGDNRMTYSAMELDATQLRMSGEKRRRESWVGDMTKYIPAMNNLANETPTAIDSSNMRELTSGDKLNMVQTFFATNNNWNLATPRVYFIRHKKRNQLKRVELCRCDPITDQAEVFAALWTDV